MAPASKAPPTPDMRGAAAPANGSTLAVADEAEEAAEAMVTPLAAALDVLANATEVNELDVIELAASELLPAV
jgi:hypothetical protein